METEINIMHIIEGYLTQNEFPENVIEDFKNSEEYKRGVVSTNDIQKAEVITYFSRVMLRDPSIPPAGIRASLVLSIDIDNWLDEVYGTFIPWYKNNHATYVK